MLTFTPDNSLSAYSCQFCGVSAQDPVPAYDADGVPIVDGNYAQVMVNDEPAASAEMTEHITAAHPAPDA